MKKYLLMTLPVLAFAAPASAQVAGMGGFRVEAMVGYDQIDIGLRREDFPAPFGDQTGPTRSGQDTGNLDGVFYGGTLGYDFAFGGVMLGVDAEYTDTSADRNFFNLSGLRTGPNAGGQGLNDAELKFGRDLYIGGRATFAISPQIRAYGKLGYTSLRAEFDAEQDVSPAARERNEFSDDIGGIRAGLGLVYAPQGRTYYGAELRYSNYDRGIDRKQAGLVVGFHF